MLQLHDYTLVRQGVSLLHDISLSIKEGEKIVLLGPSGAGKSSLLGVLREQLGDGAAWCPQEHALVPVLSVFHNIYMGALARHGSLYNLRTLIWPSADEKRHVAAVATELGLAGKMFSSVDRLSGGQAQRTALGRALYTQRPLLLADEPVSSVDEVQARQLLQWVLQRHDTAVVALHDQQLALDCFSRVIGLRNGRIVMDAPSASLTLADLQILYQ